MKYCFCEGSRHNTLGHVPRNGLVSCFAMATTNSKDKNTCCNWTQTALNLTEGMRNGALHRKSHRIGTQDYIEHTPKASKNKVLLHSIQGLKAVTSQQTSLCSFHTGIERTQRWTHVEHIVLSTGRVGLTKNFNEVQACHVACPCIAFSYCTEAFALLGLVPHQLEWMWQDTSVT